MSLELVESDSSWSEQETTDRTRAFFSAYYMVELWSRDDQHVVKMLYGGNRLEKARTVFDAALRHRPRGRHTIRQGIRVPAKWPDD